MERYLIGNKFGEAVNTKSGITTAPTVNAGCDSHNDGAYDACQTAGNQKIPENESHV